MACLRVYIDDLLLGVFTLFDREIAIGRDRDCALVLLGMDVARRHAVIHKAGHRHVLASASSKEVRVQANVIASPVILGHGDLVQIGPYTLVYESSPSERSVSQPSRDMAENDPEFVLSIAEAGHKKKTFPIRRASVRIGRGSDNDIVLRDPSVSTHHAVLERQSEGFSLRDLKSTNGTKVDGARCDTMALAVGAKIEIGKTTLQLRQQGEATGQSPLAGQNALVREMRVAAQAAGECAGLVRIEAEVGCEARSLAEEIHPE